MESDERIMPAFRRYHEANPEVYRLIDHYAYKVIASGRRRYAIANIIEKIRWEVNMQTSSGDFKINSDFARPYAALWMEDNPFFDKFFERRSKKYKGA